MKLLARFRRINKRLAIVAIFFLLVAAPLYFFVIRPRMVEAGWYSPSWGYRAPIIIVNNGSAQTNYPVEVVINTKSLQDAGKLQADCDDIRFTSSDGTTTLNYFEDYCSSTSSVNSSFFVKVSSIAASGNTTMYVYYGNASATDSQSAYADVGYPSSVVLGTGKDGAATLSGATNFNTQNITIGTCADGGDGVIYTSTATSANGTSNITLASTPSSSCLDAGDEVLIFNAQGNNTTSGSGVYEFARISSQATNVITLNHPLTNTYNGTDMKIMVQRVPNYTDFTSGANALTPSTWNGTSGGVVAFRASGNVTVNATGSINANSIGYRGGVGPNSDNLGGPTGESYDGLSTGRGGNSCGSAGCDDGATRGGGRTGDAGPTTNTTAGAVTGGGGGGGAAGSTDGTTGGGGGGGGGGYAGGGGGGGSNGDDASPPGATGGSGGTGGAAGTAAGGGAGACMDTAGAASNGNTGGNAGSSGGTGGCTNGNGSGGAVGSTTTQGGGGGGANNVTGTGAGGGGGGYYGVATLATLFFGSGGGAGGSGDSAAKGASGGAGGGIVYISSNNVTVSGNVSASGANGNGGPTNAGSGGGGAGGSVFVKTVTDNLGSSLVSSNGGTGGGAGTQIADGGDGGNGRIHIDQTDTSNATTSPTANITRVPSIGSPGTEEPYVPPGPGQPEIYWPLDEGTGTTVYGYSDNTTAVSNGTLNGTVLPTWQSADLCIHGSCLFFEGTSAIVNIPDQSIKSVSMWVRPMETANVALMDLGNGARITTDSSGNITATGITSAEYYINGVATKTPILTKGQWQHVAVTTSTAVAGDDIIFGNYSSTYYYGYMDEIRFNATQFSAENVRTEYIARGAIGGVSEQFGDPEQQAYLSDGLIGYWKMDSATTATASAMDWSGGQSGMKFASGSAFVQGKYGYGSNFVERKFSFLMESSSKLDNPKTFSFWVKPETASNTFMSINEASIQSSGGVITTTGLSNTKIYVNGKETNAISTGSWQQVVVTTDTALNSTNGDPMPDLLRYSGEAGNISAMYCVSADDCKMVWVNWQNNDDSLRFMDCDDATCTTGAVQILEGTPGCVIQGGVGCNVTANGIGDYLAMHCPTTNDCKIAFDGSGNSVRMIDCNDSTCSSGTQTVVDGSGCSLTSCNTTSSPNFDKSIFCPAGDDCKIAWYDNDGLRFADCDNAACTSGSVRMLDGAASGNALTNATTGTVGRYSDMYCPAADDCKISYIGVGLTFADCSNAACSAGQVYTLDGGSGCVLSGGDGCDTGRVVSSVSTGISCPSASDCKVSYVAASDIYMADCDTANCTSGSVETIDGNTSLSGLTNSTNNSTGRDTDISCAATDSCKIGYFDSSNASNFIPMLAACSSATCSTGVIRNLDGISTCVLKSGDGCTNVTGNSTIVIDVSCPTSSDCKVAYNNSYNSAFLFGDCVDTTCSSGSVERIEGFKIAEGIFSSIDCPAADDCKMVYLSDRASLMFMDCDNASCSSGTTRVLDADDGCVLTGGDGCSNSRNTDGYIDIDCPTATDCKIIYYGSTDSSALFADCADATCSSGSVEILDGAANCSLTGGEGCSSTRDAGFYPTLDCPSGTNCKITYFNDTVNSTMFGDCDDATCSTGSTETIDGSGCGLTNCTTTSSMRVGSVHCPASDDCKISYQDNTANDLRFADCDNETCSSGTVQIVDGGAGNLTGGNNTATLGDWNSIYCPTVTNCKIAYRSSSDTQLKFADCDDATCDTGTISVLDGGTGCTLTGGDTCNTTISAGTYTILQCPASDNCKIIYQYATNDSLFFGDCSNETCSSGSTEQLEGLTGCALSGGDGCSDVISTGYYAWLSCPTSDDCKVSYYDNSNGALQFGDCGNESCSTGNMYYADMGYDTTVLLGRVGESSYFDGMMDEVRLFNRILDSNEVANLYEWSPGPVGWWKFDENTGTTAYDASGNANTGTLTNDPRWTVGKYGSSINFDGSNDYVDISSPTLLDDLPNGDMTVSLWFNQVSFNGNPYAYLINKSNDLVNGWTLYSGSNYNIIFYMDFSTTDLFYTSSNPIYSVNTWNHLAVAYMSNSKSVKMYLNGIDITPSGTNGNGTYQTDSSRNLNIGQNSGAGGNRFNGQIDDVRVYNYARTQKEVVEDMNAGHPAPGSPVGSALAEYRFDEGAGTTVTNHGNAGTAINGTITNARWTLDGKWDKALVFNGTDSYVDLGLDTINSRINGASGVTLVAWMKPSSYPGGSSRSRMISIHRADANSSALLSVFGTQKVEVAGRSDGGDSLQTANATVPDPYSWHQVIGVFDYPNDQIKIYIDGKLTTVQKVTFNSTSYTAGTPTNSYDSIGAFKTTFTGDYFDGTLDAVKIFNSGLSDDQIKQEYNQGSATVIGSLSTQNDGLTASNSAAVAYCIPGDTAICSPPVAVWEMDEGSWSGTSGEVKDVSGNNIGGVRGGNASTGTGKVGKAGLFDGTGDYVQITNNSALQITQNITLSAWIKPSAAPGTFGHIMVKNSGSTWSSPFGYYRLYIDSDLNARFEVANATDALTSACDSDCVEDADVLSLNEWHHLTGTFNGTVQRMYVDGRLKASKTNAGFVMGSSTDPLHIGINDDTGTETFIGAIDRAMIFNYPRTDEQILWDYNRGAPVAYFNFDECTGSTLNNRAINADNKPLGYNGTIGIATGGTQNATGTCTGNSTDAWKNGANGKFGSSLNFDGSDDYVQIASYSALTNTNNITVSAWVKPGNQTTFGHILVHNSKLTWTSSFGFYRLYLGSDEIPVFEVANASDGLQSAEDEEKILGTGAISQSAWHHLAGSYDGSFLRLYIDGKLNNTKALSGFVIGNSDYPIHIGLNDDTGNEGFIGQIDDVRIYNYRLTDVQMRTLYNESSAVRFGPVTGSP